MATMEKSKQKPKKKANYKRISDANLQITTDVPNLLTIDHLSIEEPNTSSCTISKESDADEAIDISNTKMCFDETKDSNEIMSSEEVSSIEEKNSKEFEATAPLLDEFVAPIAHQSQTLCPQWSAITYPKLNQIQNIERMYPKLTEMQNIENKTEARYQLLEGQEIILEPFTEMQLKELYDNPELALAEQFESEFINIELDEGYERGTHLLYEYLEKYSKSRHNVKINLLDIQNINSICKENQNKLWQIEDKTERFSGTCRDNSIVYINKSYKLAVFNEQALGDVSNNLNDILHTSCFTFVKNITASEVLKLQIDQKIQEIMSSCPEFLKIKTRDPIEFANIPGTIMNVNEVRNAISILFSFLRRPIADLKFLEDLKSWLFKLIGLHLRVSTWQDHLFLLFHILRCPAGTATWAAPMIQIPKPHLENDPLRHNFEIHHCLAILNTILHPIKKRNEFLKNMNLNSSEPLDPVRDDLWILVDSDGEEGSNSSGDCTGPKESDLVCLINQIPWKNIYSHIIGIQWRCEEAICYEDDFTAHSVLKFIGFSTMLIKMLGEGLRIYNTERYKQFAKRLGRLIKHTVQYASDMFNIFKKNKAVKDPYICTRIQIEYDAFLIRASNYIYKSRSLGTWQYLAILPFEDLSRKSLWKLYYFLHVGFPDDPTKDLNEDYMQKVEEQNFMEKFNDAIIDVPAEDLYYLLQTFMYMISPREQNDWGFIRIVILDLLEIGFINESTKELCFKTSRDLLVNITTNYPEFISQILLKIKDNFEKVQTSGVYLFKFLPLKLWRPGIEELEILAGWLLNNSIESYENLTSRVILSQLNWNFDSNENLFLSYDIHIRMACLIVDVATKHAPESIGSGISESVRQVSHLMKNQTTRIKFLEWCWKMATILKLHAMDQSHISIQETLKDPSTKLLFIPELERLQAICLGVSESRPIAIYLAVLSTLHGHSVPQICLKGFNYLLTLIKDYRHSFVIRCLQLILPMFLECPESISKCDKFQLILNQILTSDRTYMKMAKDLISNDSPGPVVEMMGNMIQTQLINYSHYGLNSPTLFVNLWLQCLTEYSNWNKDWNAMYIIDLILRVAYQFTDAWNSARDHFFYLHIQLRDTKNTKSTYISFLSSSSSAGLLPLLPTSTLWLALMTFEIEHEIYEIQTNIWPELLKQLIMIPGKVSLDHVLKKASQAVGANNYSSSRLILYRMANLIIACPVEHCLLAIMCQKFFTLYLARVPINPDDERFFDTFGVSNKFYDSELGLMKKLKKRLLEAESYYQSNSLQECDEPLSQFYNHISKMFRTFTLWLEETQILKMKAKNITLPPQYNTNKLSTIFEGNHNHWPDLLDLASIRKIQKECSNLWLSTIYRLPKEPRLHASLSSNDNRNKSPLLRIIEHLKSYDVPIEPPCVVEKTLLIDLPSTDLNRFAEKMLNDDIKSLIIQAERFNLLVKELNALDCHYKELVRELHKNEDIVFYQKIKCNSLFATTDCTGPADIEVAVKKVIINKFVSSKINDNRERHSKLIELQTMPTSNDIVMAIVRIRHLIKSIVDMYILMKDHPTKKISSDLGEIGIKFFYKVINATNEFVSVYPPTNQLSDFILSQLGIIIQANHDTEGKNLLQTAIQRPQLMYAFEELIVPSLSEPQYFLPMYKFMVDSYIKRASPEIVFMLLSKFDICNWLHRFKPKLTNINSLITLIMEALEAWKLYSSDTIQSLFRSHLIHLFEYQFPEHYGDVMHIVLRGVSTQKLSNIVLIDILNSLYMCANCKPLQVTLPLAILKEDIRTFATTQKILTHEELIETAVLLSKHFQKERLQHGLHGLYTKHSDYCESIVILLCTISQAATVGAVHSFPGVLGDQLLDWFWPSFCDLFSPWLVPYYPQHMKETPANWIKHITSSSPILLPWSEVNTENAQKIMEGFINCLSFLLETLPANVSLFRQLFHWYEMHFANPSVPRYILKVIHSCLITLPWEIFEPSINDIDSCTRILQQFIPECHSFTGYIFVIVPWTSWLNNKQPTWDYNTRCKMLSSLLLIFVKLSYEPHVREGKRIISLLNEALNYPWRFLDYPAVENVLDWFVMSTEPSCILNLPSEHAAIDASVINLLEVVSYMDPSRINDGSSSLSRGKRILYVRSIVKLLRMCGSKCQQLLNTKDGKKAFHKTVIDLLNKINDILLKSSIKDDQNTDSVNLMIEFVGSFQSQSEMSAKLFVEAILIWQSTCSIGNVLLCSTLNATSACKQSSNSICMLLEATLFNYFKHSESTWSYHRPSWESVEQRTGHCLMLLPPVQLLQENFLLCFHLYGSQKIKMEKSNKDRINFLENLQHWLTNYKTTENNEGKIALLWGFLVVSAFKTFQTDSNSTFFISLARFMLSIATRSEGWGESILGVIGLKKDLMRKRILMRCLACYMIQMHAAKNGSSMKEYEKVRLDLLSDIPTKKFGDFQKVVSEVVAIMTTDEIFIKNVVFIVRKFYSENFLFSLENFWN